MLPKVMTLSTLAFDCDHEETKISRFAADAVEICEKEEKNIFLHHKTIQVIQERKIEEIKVYHCYVSKISMISYCGAFSHVSLVAGGLSRQLVKLTASECQDIHVSHKFKYGNTEILDVFSNSTRDEHITEVGTVNADSSCIGVKIVKNGQTYENAIILSTLTIKLEDYTTTIDMKTNEILFDDATSCPVEKGQCFSSTKGVTYWNYNSFDNCNKKSKDILYEGPATISSTSKYNSTDKMQLGDVVTVQNQEKLMSLEIIGTDHLCYQLVFRTDFKRISVVVKNPIFGFYFEKSNQILAPNIDLPLYLNAKFYYIARNFDQQIRSLHQEVRFASCQASRDNILNKLHVARQQEVSYAHILTNEKGYITMLSGDTFISIKCVPVLAEVRETETCHKHLPVSYKNKSLFIETIGKTITHDAAEIPCARLAPAIFHIAQNTWISAGKFMNYAKKPITLKPNNYVQNLKFQDVSKYMVAGIYSTKQLESFNEFVRYPMKRKTANNYITETIIKNQKTDGDFQIRNILSTEELSNLKDSFLQAAEEKILRFGSIMGAITGIILLIQIIKYMISVIINFNFLKATLGSGLHLLASLFTSLTNFVIRNNVQNAENIAASKIEEPDT